MRDYKETANKITVSLSYDFFVRPLEVKTSHPTIVTKTIVLILPLLLKKKRENEIPQVKEIGARANLQSTRVNPL
jgi:hypothetical protein